MQVTPKILKLLLVSLLWVSCKPDKIPAENQTIRLHNQHEFDDVRKAIHMSDGSSVYIGVSGGQPSVLALNSDFSLKYFKRFSDYGPGGFNNVCEMTNGDIAIVGYTNSSTLGASAANRNALMIRINQEGDFISYFTDTTNNANDQFTAVKSLQNEELLLSSYSGTRVTTFQLNANSKLVNSRKEWFNGNEVREGYCNSLFTAPNGKYVEIGNHTVSQLSTAMTLYAIEIYADQLTKPNNLNTYRAYNPRSWNNVAKFAPIRGEACPSENNGGLFYGTTNFSDNKYSILLLGMHNAGGIYLERQFYGNGQAVFQNMVPFSKGYLLLGSTVDSTKSFQANTYDTYIAAIDEQGNLLWEQTIHSESRGESALSAHEEDGIIRVSGFTQTKNSNFSFLQVYHDINGNLIH